MPQVLGGLLQHFAYFFTLSEPSHPAAQVLRSVLLQLQRQERAHRGHEQPAAVGAADARPLRPQGVHLQEESVKGREGQAVANIQGKDGKAIYSNSCVFLISDMDSILNEPN